MGRKRKGKKLSLKRAFAYSFLLHALLLSFPLGCHGGGRGDGSSQGAKQSKADGEKGKDKQAKKKNGSGNNEEITEKPQELEVQIVSVPVKKSEAQIKAEQWKRHVDQCKKSFGGIGIKFDPFDGRIEKVYKNYPADVAGMREGDVMVGDPYSIRGEIGTTVEVKIMRDGKPMTMQVTRGKICYEDAVRENSEAK